MLCAAGTGACVAFLRLPLLPSLAVSVISLAFLTGAITLKETFEFILKAVLVAALIYMVLTFHHNHPHKTSVSEAATPQSSESAAGPSGLEAFATAAQQTTASLDLGFLHSLGRLAADRIAKLLQPEQPKPFGHSGL